jgi:hypothetical protein
MNKLSAMFSQQFFNLSVDVLPVEAGHLCEHVHPRLGVEVRVATNNGADRVLNLAGEECMLLPPQDVRQVTADSLRQGGQVVWFHVRTFPFQ